MIGASALCASNSDLTTRQTTENKLWRYSYNIFADRRLAERPETRQDAERITDKESSRAGELFHDGAKLIRVVSSSWGTRPCRMFRGSGACWKLIDANGQGGDEHFSLVLISYTVKLE